MQSKKGIYLLVGLISTILIFFFILFFVHENTLENGILFTVSFEYENAKNIQYNFYNQSGKIEKVEGDNKFLLEKTDYNTVKLLRRITKKLKTSKTPFQEEGITIYNDQNKRYYLIPYDSDAATELSSLIIDGYIHAERKRVTGKDNDSELYIYQTEEGKNEWTKNGHQENIIHTYQCVDDSCKIVYVEPNGFDIILWDKKYYHYNYVNRIKQAIETEHELTTAKFMNWNHRNIGVELTDSNNLKAYYDLEKKEFKTDFSDFSVSFITNQLLLKQKNVITAKNNYEFIVWSLENNQEVWNLQIEDKPNLEFSVLKININENDYYILKRIEKELITYKLINKEGNLLLNGTDLLTTEEGYFVVDEKSINQDVETKYLLFDSTGNFIKESETLEKNEE